MIDKPEFWTVTDHTVVGRGRVMSFVEDVIDTPTGESITRQWCTHPGAVSVIAWNDRDEVMALHQYRHPVATKLVEPPAGLLDIAQEDWLHAAQRELAEEAMIAAADWRVLVDIFTSPGGIQESIRIYLAREISPAPLPEGFVVEGEEADMSRAWISRQTLVEQVMAGRIQSPTMVSGILALETARLAGRLDDLRPADAPWPARETKALQDRKLAQ